MALVRFEAVLDAVVFVITSYRPGMGYCPGWCRLMRDLNRVNPGVYCLRRLERSAD